MLRGSDYFQLIDELQFLLCILRLGEAQSGLSIVL